MCEEGVVAIQDMSTFFVDFTAAEEDVGIDEWVAEGRDIWENKEMAVDIVANSTCAWVRIC